MDNLVDELRLMMAKEKEENERREQLYEKRKKIYKLVSEIFNEHFDDYGMDKCIKLIEEKMKDDEENVIASKIIQKFRKYEDIMESQRKLKHERNYNVMNKKELVQALKEAILPLSEKIDNMDINIKEMKERLTNVETDVNNINLQMENRVLPGIQVLKDGHHGLYEKLDKVEKMIEEISPTVLALDIMHMPK